MRDGCICTVAAATPISPDRPFDENGYARRVNPIPLSLLPDGSTADNGHLSIAGCRVDDLVAEYGTPLFIYDESQLRARARSAVATFGDGAVYASKAFLCLAMASLVHEEGMRIDVATGGEMFVALQAGVPADRLVFHGNNKSTAELKAAIDAGVGRVVVDSFDELDRIELLVAAGARPPEVFLRITPGIEAHTHEYIATGQDDSKFGFTVSSGLASQAVDRAMASPAVLVRGVHAHIGSQVFRVESYAEALGVLADFAKPFEFPEMVIGGGLGVAYVEGESASSIEEWGRAIHEAADVLGITSAIWAEPGRAITAAAAITVYSVGTIKRLEGLRTYVAVDGGMSDNPRPVLYGSGYETFVPDRVDAERTESIRLVGKHCESGDMLVREGWVPAGLAVDDLIATPVTGAYGQSMGSNYNKILRPPVVFARGGNARLVVRREEYADLIRNDL